MRNIILALCACAIAFAQPAFAQDDNGVDVSITAGVDYSSGDFGTGIDTDFLVVPLNARISTGDLRFNVSIPYLRIEGSDEVVGGDGGPIIVDPNAPVTNRSGIGDLTVGVNYAIPQSRFGLGIDLGARVKLPTAETGLGTGKTDISFAAEISRTFAMVTPFAQVGYRILGDPDGIEFRNTWFASVGASAAVGKSVILASYDYRQSPISLIEDSQEVFGALSTPLSQALNLTVYGSVGLSEGAPDFGAGAAVTIGAF